MNLINFLMTLLIHHSVESQDYVEIKKSQQVLTTSLIGERE